MTNKHSLRRYKSALLLLPSLIGFLVFYIVSFIMSFGYIFKDGAPAENFRYLFSNKFFITAVINTVRFTVIAAPAAILIALVLALLTIRFARRIPFIRKAFFIPVVLPSAVITILWNLFFAAFPPFESLMIIYIWKYSGLYFMLIITALAAINKEILDAASIDGAGYTCSVIYVMIPCIIPTLFFTLILSIVNSLKIFRESYLLWGNYPDTDVYMYQNFLNNHFDKLNYSYIAAASVVFAAAVYILIAVLFIVEKNWSKRIW